MSKKLNDLKAAQADFVARAEAINSLAEKEGREFNAEEKAEWDSIMAEGTGEIAKMQAKIDNEEKLVAEQKRLAAIKSQSNAIENPLAPNPVANAQPQVFHRLGRN